MTRDVELQGLKQRLQQIADMGWVKNQRAGNDGGVGNTLEDLLEVPENNFPLPDLGEWEIKAQRKGSGSLLTLFHVEPEPSKLVPSLLLPKYSWKHQEAGKSYGPNERSFRQTIKGNTPTGRGFFVIVNADEHQIEVHFKPELVDAKQHGSWLKEVEQNVGLGDLNPVPYWKFSTIEEKLHKKLNNTLYFRADTKRTPEGEFYNYKTFKALVDPTIENFIALVESGKIYVDFDARTGHNHGTKIRIESKSVVDLFSDEIQVD